MVHSDKEWWFFEEGTWQKDSGEYLWNIITETFVYYLRNEIPKGSIPVNEIVRYLGSSTATFRLIKALSYKLGGPRFIVKLDSTVGLLGMKNGTYDINSKTFRKPYLLTTFHCHVVLSIQRNIRMNIWLSL